jgi:predicted MFS family arabinose efflux permease
MAAGKGNLAAALICGGLIVAVSFGIRQTFGMFLKPMAVDVAITREVFGFAMAIQQIVWGAAQPFAGMVADRLGSGRVVVAGALLYGLGVMMAPFASEGLHLHVALGVLVGLGLSGTTFAVVLGAVGRRVPASRRSAVLGLVTALGSFGMFAFVPVGQMLLARFGWADSLVILAGSAALMAALAFGVAGRPEEAPGRGAASQTLAEALGEAGGHRSYWLLNAGFFVCGFHIAFLVTHLPAYLSDGAVPPMTAAWTLALVGLFNIFGSYLAGVLGGRHSKKWLLSALYLARALAIAAFVAVPLSEATALAFGAVMGLLWLSTVPLTSGLVAVFFGPRYMSTLFGIVFFSHQLGSFAGAWLGGYAYELTGSYDAVWMASIALGVLAAIVHLPIAERPVPRLAGAAA